MALPRAIADADRMGDGRPKGLRWRDALPKLQVRGAVLREVMVRDAPSLARTLANAEVLRYLSPGPRDAEQFARFIRWVRRERRNGRYACFTVVLPGEKYGRGLFQLWPVEPGFGTAEMGFALDPALWGTNAFLECATAVVDFAFTTLGVRRLEFRAAVENGRGNGALRKLHAVPEGNLRNCFECTCGVVDHTMWAILADEWNERRRFARRRVT